MSTTETMRTSRRMLAYTRQTGRTTLTPKQRRRMLKKNRRLVHTLGVSFRDSFEAQIVTDELMAGAR